VWASWYPAADMSQAWTYN